jgi:hypothetical protein
MGEMQTKAPMGEGAGRLRITLDVEVNEELLTAAKDSIANIGHSLPEMVSSASGMMRRGGEKGGQGTQT